MPPTPTEQLLLRPLLLLQLLLLPQQHLLLLLLLHVCHAQPFSDQWFVWRQLPILFFRVSGKG